MDLTIIDIISVKFDKLSNKQKKIAEYVMKNRDKIGFMNLKEMSTKINVSEVTILNFCKSIGIDSFTELKRQFQELIITQLHVPTEIKHSLQELDNLNDVVNNTIQIHKFNYEKIIQNNDINVLNEVSQIISKAKTIYICGQGLSKVIAEYLSKRLKIINIDSKILEIGDIMSSSIELTKVTKDDCFILISFPKYSHNIINLAQYLNDNNYSFITITDSNKSPLVREAKAVLKCDSDSLIFHNFISATISLIELLLVVLSFNMKDKIMLHLDNLEQIRSSLMNYITSE